MSMSTHVVGIKPPDKKWQKMKAAYDACIEADIEVPEEVQRFFNYETPDDKGVLVDLDDAVGVVDDYEIEGASGFEVNLDKLAKDIRIIRFYNSW